jgi:hypothetical protein
MVSAALLVGTAGCGPSPPSVSSARVIELPAANGSVDFDDTVYSSALGRVLVPARAEGLYLLNPARAQAVRTAYGGSADSVDAGRGGIFVLDRSGSAIHVLDADGQAKSSASTAAGPDYLRYVAATDELWISEPGGEGIEVFALGKSLDDAPRRTGFISVPGGVEGLALTSAGETAYTHSGGDIASIDVKTRGVTARWPSGCRGTHGFPQIDEKDGFLLASCAENGKVTLLNLKDGRIAGDYQVGRGRSLPAYSPESGHFYVRSDPGTTLATLKASPQGLELVRKVQVPGTGHCLRAAKDYYWTCDADAGRVLLFEDQ